MTIIRILRTTAFKLSILFIATFVILAIASGIYISQSSRQALQDRFNESVLSELEVLSDHYQQGGLPRLIRIIQSKAQEPGAFLLLVTDFNGNPQAGNFKLLSRSILNQADGSTVQIQYQNLTSNSERSTSRPAIVRIFELGDRGRFVIGRDISEFVHFSNTLDRALLLVLVGMITIAVLGWLFFGRRALKRMNSVSENK